MYTKLRDKMTLCSEKAILVLIRFQTSESLLSNHCTGKAHYINVMDFEKAFDSVDRQALWRLMKLNGISEQFINQVKSQHEGVAFRVVHSVPVRSRLYHKRDNWGKTKRDTVDVLVPV